MCRDESSLLKTKARRKVSQVHVSTGALAYSAALMLSWCFPKDLIVPLSD